jgi:DNA recombination protein RmuC
MRKGLDRAVESYNKAVGSFEGRVLVTARKLQDMDPGLAKEIAPMEPLHKIARPPLTPESE